MLVVKTSNCCIDFLWNHLAFNNQIIAQCEPGCPSFPGPDVSSGVWSRVINLNKFQESKCGINEVKSYYYFAYCEQKHCSRGQALIDGKCYVCLINLFHVE